MSHRQLTGLQQAILDVLWKAGPSTAERIRENLAPDHPLKDSTVRTLLRRLEARGCLTPVVDGNGVRRSRDHAAAESGRAVGPPVDRPLLVGLGGTVPRGPRGRPPRWRLARDLAQAAVAIDAVYRAETVLGVLALKDGDRAAAVEHMRAAAAAPAPDPPLGVSRPAVAPGRVPPAGR